MRNPLVGVIGIVFLFIPITGISQNRGFEDVNKSFDLQIVDERIRESRFHRSTDISIDHKKLNLTVGAGVSASSINVILRGITGRIRFRASLGALDPGHQRLDIANPR